MKQYIDKAAVVAEIKERINRDNEMAASYSGSSEHDYLCRVKEAVYKDLLSFLDTLEVKEVDLDGEINLWVRNLHRVPNFEELNKFAKHFFELGLKANKGE